MNIEFNPIAAYVDHIYSQVGLCDPNLLENFIETHQVDEYALVASHFEDHDYESHIVEYILGEGQTKNPELLDGMFPMFTRVFRSSERNMNFIVFHVPLFTLGDATHLAEFCETNDLGLDVHEDSWWGKEYTKVIICEK